MGVGSFLRVLRESMDNYEILFGDKNSKCTASRRNSSDFQARRFSITFDTRRGEKNLGKSESWALDGFILAIFNDFGDLRARGLH